jgi:hypothetical protein
MGMQCTQVLFEVCLQLHPQHPHPLLLLLLLLLLLFLPFTHFLLKEAI